MVKRPASIYNLNMQNEIGIVHFLLRCFCYGYKVIIPITAYLLVVSLGPFNLHAAISGLEVHINKVSISGNTSFSKSRLQQVMQIRPSRFWNKIVFRNSMLEADQNALIFFYRSQGFLQVKVDIDSSVIDTLNGRINVWFTVVEGERTFVKNVEIKGNGILTAKEMYGKLKTKIGNPLISKKIDDDVSFMLQKLAEKGFLEARVSSQTNVDASTNRATVVFIINEGPRVVVDKIIIQGLKKTRETAAKRELAFKEGDVLSSTKIRKSISNLYRSGLFQGAYIKPELLSGTNADSSELGERNVIIHVQEAKYFKIEGGIGYGSIDNLRASLETSYLNFDGIGRSLGMRLKYSSVLQSGELAFAEPWIIGLPLSTDATIYLKNHNEPGFKALVQGMRLSAGTKQYFNIMHTLTFRLDNIVKQNDTRSLILSNVFDTRDNIFNTYSGTFIQIAAELAGGGGYNTNHFFKLTTDMRRYFHIGTNCVLSSACRVGFIREYGSDTTIPAQEKFYLGGATTLRGFREKQLGYNPDIADTTGGRLMLAINIAEFRFPIYSIVGGACFLDAGNIWDSFQEIKYHKLRWTAGAGLRIQTPIGVVRLDYGFILDRKPYEKTGTFHPNFGQPF